uniref:UPAR/Ly6 domain-containing protein n=1 Tax=Periophthalmus magnuspinnatus TaxID=409849 RepID=A0A3B4B3W9_9GOBI
MKRTVILLLVVFVLSQSYALKCHCGGLRRCPGGPVETCQSFNQVCGSVIITAGATPNFFRGCMSASQCAALDNPGTSSAFCCRRDLCNR